MANIIQCEKNNINWYNLGEQDAGENYLQLFSLNRIFGIKSDRGGYWNMNLLVCLNYFMQISNSNIHLKSLSSFSVYRVYWIFSLIVRYIISSFFE